MLALISNVIDKEILSETLKTLELTFDLWWINGGLCSLICDFFAGL